MMKRSVSLLLALLMAAMVWLPGVAEEFTPNPAYSFLDSNTPVGERLDEILSLMTLGEKIAMSTGGTAIARRRVVGEDATDEVIGSVNGAATAGGPIADEGAVGALALVESTASASGCVADEEAVHILGSCVDRAAGAWA